MAARLFDALATVSIVPAIKRLQNGAMQLAIWLASLSKLTSLHIFREAISLACGKQVLTGL